MAELQGSKLYYYVNLLNRPDAGRAEPVRLLLVDAGIDFEYKRLAFDEWPVMKKELIAGGVRAPVLPFFVTQSGQVYTRVAPLMRRISKAIGKYIPENADDEYLIDSYSDLTLDWRNNWVQRYFIDAEKKEAEAVYAKQLERQYSIWNDILGDKDGAYVLGQEITYVDFELYALLREDGKLSTSIKNYPSISKFVKAIEARPSFQELFAQEGYPRKLE